jgi:hypothetical protein
MSSFLTSIRRGLFLVAIGASWAGTASAEPEVPAAVPGASCFSMTQLGGWKSPSPTVIYYQVRQHDVYRVDLEVGERRLQWPSMHLVTRVHGGSFICSPLDLDISVSDLNGIADRVIPKSITKLTPDQIAAIPPEYRP